MSVNLDFSGSTALAVVCAGFGGGRLASVSVVLALLSVGIERGAGGSKLAIAGSTVGLGAVTGGSFVVFAGGSFGVSAAVSFGSVLGDSFEGSMPSKKMYIH